MSSFKAILKSPKKALRHALSSYRSSMPESSTPLPLSRQAELAPTPVFSQVGVFDAKGATLTNIGRDQINVGVCTVARKSTAHDHAQKRLGLLASTRHRVRDVKHVN